MRGAQRQERQNVGRRFNTQGSIPGVAIKWRHDRIRDKLKQFQNLNGDIEITTQNIQLVKNLINNRMVVVGNYLRHKRGRWIVVTSAVFKAEISDSDDSEDDNNNNNNSSNNSNSNNNGSQQHSKNDNHESNTKILSMDATLSEIHHKDVNENDGR